jgi:hypothetical protein
MYDISWPGSSWSLEVPPFIISEKAAYPPALPISGNRDRVKLPMGTGEGDKREQDREWLFVSLVYSLAAQLIQDDLALMFE